MAWGLGWQGILLFPAPMQLKKGHHLCDYHPFLNTIIHSRHFRNFFDPSPYIFYIPLPLSSALPRMSAVSFLSTKICTFIVAPLSASTGKIHDIALSMFLWNLCCRKTSKQGDLGGLAPKKHFFGNFSKNVRPPPPPLFGNFYLRFPIFLSSWKFLGDF